MMMMIRGRSSNCWSPGQADFDCINEVPSNRHICHRRHLTNILVISIFFIVIIILVIIITITVIINVTITTVIINVTIKGMLELSLTGTLLL